MPSHATGKDHRIEIFHPLWLGVLDEFETTMLLL